MRREFSTARWRRGLRLFVPALAVLAGLSGAVTDAAAQSRICRQLESQLASVSRGGESSGQARRYDRAIEQQRAQLDRGERQYRRAGCGGGLFWRDSGGAACDSIGRGLDRMERNLAQLERTRARMGGGGGNPRRERARILAALDANDCRAERRQPDRVARQDNRGLFDQLFSNGVRRTEPRPPREVPAEDGSQRLRTITGRDGSSIQTFDGSGGGGGSHRTLCVRTCDGYYWPISYSSSQGDFPRDEQNCQTMCPGTEVKLFSHRVPDQDSENMVDAYGSPYTDLTTAFKYRDASFTRPQGCSCTAAKKNFSVIAGNGAMNVPGETETPAIALPAARPDPAADPETLANRDGSFDAEDMSRLSQAKGVDATADAERKVRVVGPAYLPDPEAAADPRAPAQTAIQ